MDAHNYHQIMPAVTTAEPTRRRPRVVLAMSRETHARLMTPRLAERLREAADADPGAVITGFDGPDARAAVRDAEILLTSWGAPRVDARALDLMPRLRAIVHAAGTVKPYISPEVFGRGVQVAAAAEANAIPVAEFTFAAIVFAAKRVGSFARAYLTRRDQTARQAATAAEPGANGIVIGVVGASRVGRRVLDLVTKNLDATVLLADPYLTGEEAASLGAAKTTLDDLVTRADIVTLHAPALPETRHMIDAGRLAAMKDNAVLINTARGMLVDTEALTEQLRTGRIEAVLDVTDPEPLPPGSPLFGLPNVLLTPHIAGAMGNEVPRLLGQAIGEIERLAAGLPLEHPVTAVDLGRIA
jgi:phosphoglycerate dehydrogenase-like enzyme